jgi:predicted regulator of amino acid metabolism with ACT domain
MDFNIQNKILTAQAIDIFKKPNFDVFEKAQLIEELIKSRRSQCPQCKSKIEKYGKSTSPKGGKNHWCKNCANVVEELAKEIGVPKKTLYETRKLIDANDETKQLVREGKIDAEKAIRIVSNLKDVWDDTKESELVHKAIDDDLSTREIETLVSETNNPKLIATHGVQHLINAAKHLKSAKQKLPKNCLKDIEVKDTLQTCKDLIKAIENK